MGCSGRYCKNILYLIFDEWYHFIDEMHNLMKNVLIFGASGHGSVVLDCLERSNDYRVVGFIDSFKKKGTKNNGYEVLGTEYDLRYITERYNVHAGVIAIGDNWERQKMAERIVKISPDFDFINVIHSSAILGKDVILGKGIVVLPGVIVNANSRIGDHCMLNTRASLGHDGIMDSFSSLAPGVCTGGYLKLGRGSAISLGTLVIQNISIGSESVIGAGSLVLKNIPDQVLAFGSPAEVIRRRQKGEVYLTGPRSLQPTLFKMEYTGS